jgi:nitroreductase
MSDTQTFQQLVRARRSVRRFLPDPLTRHEIDTVLEDAQRSPSNCNTQPWSVHIASGKTRDALSALLLKRASSQRFSPDFSWDESAFPEPLDQRRRDQGKTYYESLGIARNDRDGRMEGLLMNLRFFNAPHAAFIFMPSVGDNVRVASDLGMYAQTLLLSLQAHGFGGIPQTVLGLFAEPVRDVLGLPPEMKLLFGISFGRPDAAALAAAPYMPRAAIHASAVMHD